MRKSTHKYSLAVAVAFAWAAVSFAANAQDAVGAVKPLSPEHADLYTLDPAFYKKSVLVQNILIATSAKVSDFALLEAAYQFDMMMKDLRPAIAQRVREKGVLCILIAHDEHTSDLPQFGSPKTGKELDFYNWRNRGFLTKKNGRPTVVFAEEDVLEYDGGMQKESILIHEFGHVVDNAGFDEDQRTRLNAAYKRAKDKGLWNDGYAAQRFRRVKSEQPVLLYDALVKAFPEQSPELFKKCLAGGDILVNGKPTNADTKVTKDDQVLIVFGGPKQCYGLVNRAEYWAEGFQCWYDTNRTMDHDHNHIHTREQLRAYDSALAELCREVMGDSDWRFVSPRKRAGTGHLKGYDPATAPKVKKLEHIENAANDYYDTYWKSYWPRLYEKHSIKIQAKGQNEPPRFTIATRKQGDSVAVQGDADRTIFVVKSPSGIGQATLGRTAEAWPKRIEVRFHLSGLESVKISNGKTTLAGAVSIRDGKPAVRLWRNDAENQPLDETSPLWTAIRIRQADGTPATMLPLRDGRFEIELPAAFLAENPTSITLNWIDFYRN